MDLENDKDTIEAMNAVLRNDLPIEDKKASTTTNSKKNSKPKKKDSAFLYGNEVAVILKSSQTPEQKLATVCSKYSEQLHANRKLMTAIKMTEGRLTKMQQEIDQSQQQRSKAVLARSRLENLCRELQKLNKAQKEEIDLKLRLEEEKRKEISATFQNAFAEMNTLTSQNTEKNTKMREENLEMREKIKSVRERIELSEQQLEKVRQQAQLEVQLAEARMAKIKMEMTAEKESLLKEKQQLLLKLTEYQVKIQELSATEVGLRGQISMYTEKYDDFQNALTKSNEVFSGFNEEMAKMSKKILKLEKETTQWKQRWEKSNGALLNMAADKQTRDAEMVKLNQKVSLLQELCKAFQRERTELLAQLRAAKNGQEEKTGASGQGETDKKQVEELSKDCENLKDNLVQLQGSLAETILESKTDKVDVKEESGDKIAHEDTAVPENKEEVVKVSGEENNKEKEGKIVDKKEVKCDDISSTLDAQDDSGKMVVEEIVVEDESVELKENVTESVVEEESMKNDDEGSEECVSFEVIDKTALEESTTDATEEETDLAPAATSSSSDSNNDDDVKKHDKVEEVKNKITSNSKLHEPDTGNNEKVIDSKDLLLSPSSSGEEKKNSDKPAKKIKDGKRKKK